MPRSSTPSNGTTSQGRSPSPPSAAHPAVPSPALPGQRRRTVVVVLAILAVMLVSMAAGIYLYIVDPGGLEALFPGGS